MKTRTVPQAPPNLGTSLPRTSSDTREAVAFPPGKAHFADYALQQYGMATPELACAAAKIGKQLGREKARAWDGTVAGLSN